MQKSKLALMAAALLCSGCSQAGSVVGQSPARLALPEEIDVVFNHNATSRYRSPLTGDWRNGDDLEQWLIATIDAAHNEVLVAVQELSLPRVAQALVAAKQRGVRVQVILEKNYRQAWSEQRPLFAPGLPVVLLKDHLNTNTALFCRDQCLGNPWQAELLHSHQHFVVGGINGCNQPLLQVITIAPVPSQG